MKRSWLIPVVGVHTSCMVGWCVVLSCFVLLLFSGYFAGMSVLVATVKDADGDVRFCDRPLEGTLMDPEYVRLNDTGEVVRMNAANHTLNEGDPVIVYQECEFRNCLSDRLRYEGDYLWYAPKTKNDCEDEFATTIVWLILGTIFLCCGLLLLTGFLCILVHWKFLGVVHYIWWHSETESPNQDETTTV